MRPPAQQYFREHLAARDDVIKAAFAFHLPHDGSEPSSHSFYSEYRDTMDSQDFQQAKSERCTWCGRSRWEVRFDSLPPECQGRPADMVEYINSTIYAEEIEYADLCRRAKTEVPRLVGKLGLSGKTLAWLHQTHGYTCEIVEDCLGQSLVAYENEYQEEMRRHSQRSRP